MILRKAISALILIAVLLNVFSLSLLGEEPQKPIELMPLEELPTVIREEKISLRGHLYRIDDDSELDTVRICNADGTISVYKFAENVKYVDEDGKTRDKTNDVYVDENGNAVNKNNDIRYTLSSAISEGVTVSYGDVSVKMTPKSEMPTEDIGYSIEEQKSRAYPQKIVYEGVFSPSDRVEYTPAYSGLKEDIILYERPATNTFSFIIEVENAILENKGVYVEVIDQSGNVVGKIDAITMISSNGQIAGGEYLIEELEHFEQTVVYEVSLLLDDRFLDSPDTEYPVAVDPSVVFDSFTGSVKNIVDASLYGNITDFATGHIIYNNIGNLQDAYGVNRSIIKFPGLMNDVTFLMLPNSRLIGVWLDVYNVSNCNVTDVYAYQYSDYGEQDIWTEENVLSGRSQLADPGISSYSTAESGSLNDPFYCWFSLTDFMTDWKTSYNHNAPKNKSDKGIILCNDDEIHPTYFVRFASTESPTYRPSLEYAYTPSISFSIVGKYSTQFQNLVGAGNVYDYLNDTISFLDIVYQRDFGVKFTCASIQQRNSLVDNNNCNAYRNYSACSSSQGCGTNCRGGHHQNVDYYMRSFEDIPLAENQIIVAAENMRYGTMCREVNGVHQTDDQQCLGSTYIAYDTSSRGIVVPDIKEGGAELYLDCVPRACLMTAIGNSTYYPYIESTMKLVIAHEIAHIMGLGEMYRISTLPEHDLATVKWKCVMRRFYYPDKGYDFVSGILAPGSTKSGFCDHCKSILAKSITARYFPAYTPAP